MVWVDIAILVIITISAAISVIRGFAREALSLVAWAAAFWVALNYSAQMAELLKQWIEQPSLQRVVAYASLFVATLLVGGLINYLVGQLIKKTGLSGTDRMIGVLFGVGRGVVIVAALVLAGSYAGLADDSWWKESLFIQHIVPLAEWLKSYLPDDISNGMRFT